MSFIKNLVGLKILVHKKKEKGILKEKVLSNAGELFNELYYIYKNIYNKEKHGSNTKDTKKRV